MRFNDLRKKTLMETSIIAVVGAVMSGVIYGSIMIDDNFSEQNNALKQKVDAISADTQSLQMKYHNILQNIGLYEEIQKKQVEGQLAINRQVIQDRFNILKKKYLLASLKLTMLSIDETKDAALKRKTSTVNSSDVILTMEAISDEHIYRLLSAMQRDLPGVSGITKMSLVKEKSVTEETLGLISQKGPLAMMKGDIKFTWYGINPLDDKNAAPVAAQKEK